MIGRGVITIELSSGEIVNLELVITDELTWEIRLGPELHAILARSYSKPAVALAALAEHVKRWVQPGLDPAERIDIVITDGEPIVVPGGKA